MKRAALFLSLIGLTACFSGLTACGGITPPASEEVDPQDSTMRPSRIVSLDFCSDQFVLKLVDRERILAVSPDATKSFSYMRYAAENIPSVRSVAEDVLILKPDLIVRSYGGGPNATAFFERAGVPVVNLGWAGDLDGIKRLTLEMADRLGELERGQAVVADITARLENLKAKQELNKRSQHKDKTLYMTPSGVTTGPGSLIHEMLVAAGLQNFEEQPGWRSLPLERLAYEQPDLIAAAFFESRMNNKDAWSAMYHPVAQAQLRDQPTVMLQGAWTSCSGWFLMDAIEALAAGSHKREDQNAP